MNRESFRVYRTNILIVLFAASAALVILIWLFGPKNTLFSAPIFVTASSNKATPESSDVHRISDTMASLSSNFRPNGQTTLAKDLIRESISSLKAKDYPASRLLLEQVLAKSGSIVSSDQRNEIRTVLGGVYYDLCCEYANGKRDAIDVELYCLRGVQLLEGTDLGDSSSNKMTHAVSFQIWLCLHYLQVGENWRMAPHVRELNSLRDSLNGSSVRERALRRWATEVLVQIEKVNSGDWPRNTNHNLAVNTFTSGFQLSPPESFLQKFSKR